MKTRVLSLLMVLILAGNVNPYHYQPSPQASRTVDLIKELRPSLDTEIAAIHAKYVDKWAAFYKIPKEEVVAIAFRESEFNSCAVSNRGAIGVMQVMISVHGDKLKSRRITPIEAFSLDNNYSIGCEIFSKDRKKYGLDGALRRYVGGYHRTYIRDVKKSIKICQRV